MGLFDHPRVRPRALGSHWTARPTLPHAAPMKTASLLALLALSQSAPSQVRSVPLTLGETRLEALVHEKPGSGVVLVNVHDDENTSVEAALSVLEAQGGRLVELKHTGARLITFELEKKTYVVDPN